MAEDNSVITEPKEPKPKAKKVKQKKLVVAVVVIVIVIAGAGLGFNAWHQTPGFCDAICHNPQDPYNPTYYAEPGSAAVDKWGNEVKDASGMLAAVHRVDADSTCLSCHEPTLKEQMVEGLEWVSGDFYNPLSERSLENLNRWHEDKNGVDFCLNENCHEGESKTTLTDKTSYLARNPHSWHHSEYTCNDCHKSHRASVMICSQCHDDATIPEGWLSWDESKQLETTYLSYDQEQVVYADED